MAKRVASQSVEKALSRLGPMPEALLSVLHASAGWTTETLLDISVGGKLVVQDAIGLLQDDDFIHRSVAAVFCRRSEATLDRYIRQQGTKAELERQGKSRMRPSPTSAGERMEREFRLGFVKEVKRVVDAAKDLGDDKRAASMIARAKRAKSSVTRDASRAQIAWVTDGEGRVYTSISVAGTDGGKHLAKLFRDGGRIELLTFQAAMTERSWAEPKLRAPWEFHYLRLLDDEQTRVTSMGAATVAFALDARLTSAFPALPRPTRGRRGGRI